MTDVHELEPLLRRVRSGDAQALTALLEWLRPRVRLRAENVLGGRLGARLDASDVAQEVSLRVHRGIGGLRGEAAPQLLAWVEEILQNVVADCRKHHAAQARAVGREVGDGLFPCLASDTTALEQRVLRDERTARLEEALQRLPEKQRTVFQLRLHEQLPFEEVAKRAGVTVVNARVLMVRATERLRQELGEKP